MALTPQDHAAVAAAIAAAEKKTSAQFVCVLARASSDYAPHPDHLGDGVRAVDTVATDPIHGMERAADFSHPARCLHRFRADLLLDAAAARARSPRVAARPRASRGAGAIRPAPRRPHQASDGRANFRVAWPSATRESSPTRASRKR